MSLTHLESKKLLLDFKHIKEDLELKREMISEMDTLFNQAVNDFLKNNPELNEKWNNHLKESDEKIDEILSIEKIKEENKSQVKNDTINEIQENESIDLNEDKKEDFFYSFYKIVYREIVKKTHPDKISHLSEDERIERNRIYLDATKAYEEKQIGDLLYCAYLVKVSFKIGENEIVTLKTSINKYKQESSFLEQTYSWKWYHGDNDLKTKLVEKFIQHHINY